MKELRIGGNYEPNPEKSPFDPIWMKFLDPVLEADFCEFYSKRARKNRKGSGLVCLVVWFFWILFDYFFAPQSNFTLLIAIRMSGFAYGVAVYATLFFDCPFLKEIDSLLWGFTCIVLPSMMAVMTTLNGKFTTAGTMLTMIGANVFLDLPFHTFAIVETLVPITYAVILKFYGLASNTIILDNEFAVCTTCLILMANAYFREVNLRKEFRVTHMMLDQWRMRAEEALEFSRASQAATEAKSRFLAVMSHEMRTPLNAIYSLAQLLTQSDLPPDDMENAVIISRSCELLLALINDVLDVSRFEANAMKLNVETTDVIETVEDVLCICEGEVYKQEELEVFAKFESGIPRFISVDKNRLKQIILNITWNAVKFCHKGSISIELSVRDAPPLTPPPRTAYAIKFPPDSPFAGSCLTISIRDTGVGINEDDVPSVFEEFWQKDNSSTRKYNGAGLGLSICKKLINAMGGQLTVTSTIGVGTCFTAYLPLASLLPPSPQPPSPPPPPPTFPPSPSLSPTPNNEIELIIHDTALPAPGQQQQQQQHLSHFDTVPKFTGDIREFFVDHRPMLPLQSTQSDSAAPGSDQKLAIFINQCETTAKVLSSYLEFCGFTTIFFETLETMRAALSVPATPLPELALVFVDSNACGRVPPPLHRTVNRIKATCASQLPPHSAENDPAVYPDDEPEDQSDASEAEHCAFNFGSLQEDWMNRDDRRASIVTLDSCFSFPEYETAPNQLRAPFFPFVFFFVTNTQDRAAPAELQARGFSLQLPKPVKLSTLARALQLCEDYMALRLPHGGLDYEHSQSSALASEQATFHPERQTLSYPHEDLSPREPLRVLVVEDNPINTRVMQKMLAGDKYSVATAADGLEAIARVDEFDWDCILMDLHMPNMGGIEATRRIRSRTDSRKHVPIIVLSADTLHETITEAVNAGATDFLTKPVKMASLFEALQKASRAHEEH